MTRAVHHTALGFAALALAVGAGVRTAGRWDQITVTGLPLWVSLLALTLIGVTGVLSPALLTRLRQRSKRQGPTSPTLR